MTTPSEPHRKCGAAFPPSPLWDEKQLADYLNISPRTPQMWRHRGGGPRFIKIGAAVRYRFEDVQAWIGERTRANTADQGTEA